MPLRGTTHPRPPVLCARLTRSRQSRRDTGLPLRCRAHAPSAPSRGLPLTRTSLSRTARRRRAARHRTSEGERLREEQKNVTAERMEVAGERLPDARAKDRMCF